MAIRFKRGGPSDLQRGERLLASQGTFKAITGLALPIYRIACPSRFWSFLLRVSDRRVLLDTDLFGRWTQEVDMWFPHAKPPDQTEVISSVAVKNGLFGQCLELRSRDPRRWKWLCAPSMTLRFFFDNPEPMEQIIRAALTQRESANRPSPPYP